MTFDGGPDPAQDDRTPGPYQVWAVRVEFNADRGGDAMGTQRVRLGWDRVPDDSREAALLLELWSLWHVRVVKQANAAGANQDIFLG